MAIRIGSWGTPELGITEKIQSLFSPNKTLTSQGGSNLIGSKQATTYVPPTNDYSLINRSPGATPTPQPTYSGGTNSSSSGQVLGQYDQAPMQATPDGGEINWDEIYAPAFNALSQAEQAQQSSYQQGLGEAQSGYQSRIADLTAEKNARMANFQEQRQGETKRTDTAVAEARRMAAQLLQGLQSQYGGSTGTGAFRGEQIGAAATQNISGNREALQTALAGIAQSESALKDKVMALQNEEERTLQNAKLQLKAELDKALASIASQRGQLSVDKGARRTEALQNYRNLLAEIDANNTAFKQKLYTEAQAQAQKLNALKQSAQEKYSANLKMANLTNGQQFNVGNTAYQVAPTSEGNIQYLTGTVDQSSQDSNGDGIPDYLD